MPEVIGGLKKILQLAPLLTLLFVPKTDAQNLREAFNTTSSPAKSVTTPEITGSFVATTVDTLIKKAQTAQKEQPGDKPSPELFLYGDTYKNLGLIFSAPIKVGKKEFSLSINYEQLPGYKASWAGVEDIISLGIGHHVLKFGPSIEIEKADGVNGLNTSLRLSLSADIGDLVTINLAHILPLDSNSLYHSKGNIDLQTDLYVGNLDIYNRVILDGTSIFYTGVITLPVIHLKQFTIHGGIVFDDRIIKDGIPGAFLALEIKSDK